MAHSKRLVTQHLESVSWRLLDEYPEVVKDLIRRRPGVYALYRGDRLYYVGLASNLMGRLRTHLRDRHRGSWDRFNVYLTAHGEHIKELESLVLRIVGPKGNKVRGKFAKSENLLNTVNVAIREFESDRRAELLGGWVAKRRRRSKGRKARGKGALRGLVSRRLTLKAWYKGYEYTASLRKDGTIRYGRRVFDTPNAAAKAVLKRPASGWHFWRIKDSSGKWVRLASIKR